MGYIYPARNFAVKLQVDMTIVKRKNLNFKNVIQIF